MYVRLKHNRKSASNEADFTHNFVEELRDPKKDEEFLVWHYLGGYIIYPVIAFKVKNEQELSVLRFSEMKLNKKDAF